MRELSVVPDEVHDIVSASLEGVKRLIASNIAVTSVKTDPDLLADIVLTFFTGLCLEQNLSRRKAASLRKIDGLIEIFSRM